MIWGSTVHKSRISRNIENSETVALAMLDAWSALFELEAFGAVKHVTVLTENLRAKHCNLLFRRVNSMTALHVAVCKCELQKCSSHFD